MSEQDREATLSRIKRWLHAVQNTPPEDENETIILPIELALESKDDGVPTVDRRGYRDIVFNSRAYKWLQVAIGREALLYRLTDHDSMLRIQSTILNATASPPTLSRKIAPAARGASFIVDWDPTEFLHDQFVGDGCSLPTLTEMITLTGSMTGAEVLPCGDYLEKIWPWTWCDVLSAIQEAITTRRDAVRKLQSFSLCFSISKPPTPNLLIFKLRYTFRQVRDKTDLQRRARQGGSFRNTRFPR